MSPPATTSIGPSRVLWICDRFSVEQLMRALLLAEKIRFPFSQYEPSRVFDTCLERGRVELFPAGTEQRWFGLVAGQQDEIYRWAAYFGEKICRAFAAGHVDVEMHESGRRIAWAWDDGHATFPDKLFPRGDFFTSPHFDMPLWDRLERELMKEGFGANPMQANFAVNVAPDRAMDKLLIEVAMRELAAEAEPYSRLGLLAQDAGRLTWITGTARDGTAFEPLQPSTADSVLTAMLGVPTGRLRFESIPIDRFLDLGEEMKASRDAFAARLARWSDELAAATAGEDRNHRLARLRRDEVIPAMEEFNRKANVAARSVLGSVSSSDLGKVLLAGIAVASALVAGAALNSPEVGALSGVGAGAVVKTVQDWVANRRERNCSWTAFASALSDELGRWSPRPAPEGAPPARRARRKSR